MTTTASGKEGLVVLLATTREHFKHTPEVSDVMRDILGTLMERGQYKLDTQHVYWLSEATDNMDALFNCVVQAEKRARHL